MDHHFTIEELKEIDENAFNSLDYIMKDENVEDMDLTFTITEKVFSFIAQFR